jgi:hypothetical protein
MQLNVDKSVDALKETGLIRVQVRKFAIYGTSGYESGHAKTRTFLKHIDI